MTVRRLRHLGAPIRRGAMIAGLLAALTLGGAALAWFSGVGSGSATAAIGTLAAPSITGASGEAGTVALSWSAVTPPGSGTVTYSVSRNGGTAGGNCPSSSSLTTVTSCTDTGLSAGTYQYVVTAYWSSWTAHSAAANVTVTSGAATHLVLSAATTTPVAGAADNLTVTAKDSAGNTVTAYTGAKSLTLTGASTIGSYHPTVTDSFGAAVNFGTAETIIFSSGVATVSGSSNGVMRLYKAETVNVIVSDGTINNGSGLPVTVSAGSAASLTLTAQTTTPSAGVTDALTITATDAFGNTATSYTGSKNLTFSGAGTIGGFAPTVTNSSGTAVNFGSSTAITFTNGVATVSGSSNGVMTLYRAGTASIVVSDGTINNGSGLAVTVSSAASAKLAFTQQPSNSTGGIAFPTQPQVTVQDQYSNTAANNSSTVTLAITGGTGTSGATLSCATNPLAATAGVASFSGCKIDKAGSGYTLTATDGALTAAISNSFNVTAGPAAKLAFTQQPSGAVAGSAFTTQPIVTIQDAGGNTVTSDTSSVTLAITSGTGTGGASLTCTANPLAATAGVASFSGCTIDKAGTGYTLTATDGTLALATSNAFNVTATSIVWVATGSTVTRTSSGTLSPPIPSGLSVNDFMLLIVANTTANVSSAPTGWTPVATIINSGNPAISLSVFYRLYKTGDTAPSVTVNTDAGGASAQIVAFRGVNTTTPLDVASVTSVSPAGLQTTFAPTGLTTVTSNARAESIVAENDAFSTPPTLSFSNSQGFSAESGFPDAPAVGNTGNSHAIDVAGKAISSAGSVTFPTYTTSRNGVWAGVSVALRP